MRSLKALAFLAPWPILWGIFRILENKVPFSVRNHHFYNFYKIEDWVNFAFLLVSQIVLMIFIYDLLSKWLKDKSMREKVAIVPTIYLIILFILLVSLMEVIRDGEIYVVFSMLLGLPILAVWNFLAGIAILSVERKSWLGWLLLISGLAIFWLISRDSFGPQGNWVG